MVTTASVSLFKKAARDVPAYKDFLKVNQLNPESIKSVSDFNKIPQTSKKQYLEKYPMPDLIWGGTLSLPLLFCSTSGSTGEPFYFPRNDILSEQYSHLIEDFLSGSSNSGPVLVINGFGMGVWIGGILTHRAFEIATTKMQYPASILPVGYNKTEVIKALERLSPKFSQTILIGYPPFIKEIIDEAIQRKINLSSYNMRFLFAAEAFTETFRDYICSKTGADPVIDTLNIYGTADIGAMAYETPISIIIRRLATKNAMLFQDIFGQIEKTPTLAQYNPDFAEFEEVNGDILLTGDSSIPLIRYSLGDHGGVISYTDMVKILKRNNVDIETVIDNHHLKGHIRHFPFVYVYERANFSVTLHGINIYPEFIKEGLLNQELVDSVTEKFTMLTKFDVHHNQYIEINLELQKNVEPTIKLKTLINQAIREKLIKKSSEFAEISRASSSKKLIKINLWPYEYPKYFSPGVKQKWVLKED